MSFIICMLLWAGILDLEMTVYRWQEQVGTINHAILLLTLQGVIYSDTTTAIRDRRR